MTTAFRRSSGLSATRTRQASWGRHMFWVMLISIALAMSALFGSWAFHYRALRDAEQTLTPDAAVTGRSPAASALAAASRYCRARSRMSASVSASSRRKPSHRKAHSHQV